MIVKTKILNVRTLRFVRDEVVDTIKKEGVWRTDESFTKESDSDIRNVLPLFGLMWKTGYDTGFISVGEGYKNKFLFENHIIPELPDYTVEGIDDRKGIENNKGFIYGRSTVRVSSTNKVYIYVVSGWTDGWCEL